MDSSSKVKSLLRAGQRAQALSLISAALKRNANDVEAWWLLSFAIEDRDRQIYAVRRVLALSPANPSAERRLAQLDPLAGINTLRTQAAPPTPRQAMSHRMPEGGAVIATPAARRWTLVLVALFGVTIATALLLNAALQTKAAEQAAIEELAVAPATLPAIVVVLPSETPQATSEAVVEEQPTLPAPTEAPPSPTPTATVAPTEAVPLFDQFVQSIANGDGSQRVGVYVEDLFQYPIVEQPSSDPAWITSNFGEVTEFRIVRQQTGNEGLIAHNYLAGGLFFSLQVGDIAELVLGDGSVIEFEIFAIEDYQALSPNSPTSNFLSLATGEKLSASDLFYRVYGGNMTLTFQTCINRDNISTWGRTFIIGEEL